MRDSKKRNKSCRTVLGTWILMVLVLFGQNTIIAQAQENTFGIEAKKLPANEETYDIQISVENPGTDWEGTVRLVVEEDYLYPTAYDTVISLPQGSTKQFVVKVPLKSVEESDGSIKVLLLDKQQEKVAEKEYRHFLREGADALVMGILSDDYSSLTYLDMGGEEMYFYGTNFPIRLMELNQDNLEENLASLEFLVIDKYNTGILTDEEIQEIALWNNDGGILIVGTGSYAEDTLRGLGDSYLGVKCTDICEPEEESQLYESEEESQLYEPGEENQIYATVDMEINWSQIPLAELRDMNNQYNQQYWSHAWSCPVGDGAIGVLPYSLTELAKVNTGFYGEYDQLSFVMDLLDGVSSEANARYNNSYSNGNSYYSSSNMLYRMLRVLGSINSPLQLGVLKVMVIIYVIFVGPVLYLILRFAKKRELYWVAVPVTALLGVILISLAGRGFEVVDTRVYSVTMENLSGKEDSESYLYCYDAKNKEWELKLSKDYEYVGNLVNNSYYYGDEDVYYHHVKQEGDRLSFGIKPSSNFEDSYFFAGKGGKYNTTNGTIDCNGIMMDWGGITGTITNNTDKDFRYYAVIEEDSLYVYENLPSGASCSLANQEPVYVSGYDIWYDYMYNFLEDSMNKEKAEKSSVIAALGIGICSAYTQSDVNATVVIGVVEDWNKTVDDNCKEVSYGCLYVVQ